MTIHILDWIVFFGLGSLLWYGLHKMSDGAFTTDKGGLQQGVGCLVMGVYTLIYLVIFWGFKYNIVDIPKLFNIQW